MSSQSVRKILVIDPDCSIRGLMAALLQRVGIASECVADRDSALQRCRSEHYDAVLIEPRMRHGDALLDDLSALAAAGGPGIIVATTPAASADGYASRDGVRAILMKPFALEQFYTAVAACCDGASRGPAAPRTPVLPGGQAGL